MDGIETSFGSAACGMESRGGIGITGNIKFTAVGSDKGVLSHELFHRKAEIELFKKVSEGKRQEL